MLRPRPPTSPSWCSRRPAQAARARGSAHEDPGARAVLPRWFIAGCCLRPCLSAFPKRCVAGSTQTSCDVRSSPTRTEPGVTLVAISGQGWQAPLGGQGSRRPGSSPCRPRGARDEAGASTTPSTSLARRAGAFPAQPSCGSSPLRRVKPTKVGATPQNGRIGATPSSWDGALPDAVRWCWSTMSPPPDGHWRARLACSERLGSR